MLLHILKLPCLENFLPLSCLDSFESSESQSPMIPKLRLLNNHKLRYGLSKGMHFVRLSKLWVPSILTPSGHRPKKFCTFG